MNIYLRCKNSFKAAFHTMHVATCTTFFIDLKKEGGGTGKSECNEDHEPNLAGDYMEDIIEHKGIDEAKNETRINRGTLHRKGY